MLAKRRQGLEKEQSMSKKVSLAIFLSDLVIEFLMTKFVDYSFSDALWWGLGIFYGSHKKGGTATTSPLAPFILTFFPLRGNYNH